MNEANELHERTREGMQARANERRKEGMTVCVCTDLSIRMPSRF